MTSTFVAGHATAHLPLSGSKIIEIAAIGPVPFCATLLAGHGADVLRIDRPGGSDNGLPLGKFDPLLRGRSTLDLDLKSDAGRAALLDLVADADALIEGFRPGVMERLGLGPHECQQRNPRLVYGRVTGWGQTGPRAMTAGHDINYIALAGVLGAIGPAQGPPIPPINLVGDYAGGAMMLAFGVLAGMLSARSTGYGTVIDAGMVDGAAFHMSIVHGLLAAGRWVDRPSSNVLDGAAPHYTTYPAADGRYVAVGAIEEKFWVALLKGLGLDPRALPDRGRPANWPALREVIGRVFITRTRDAWDAIFRDTDACVTPVLSLAESAADPHLVARHSIVAGPFAPEPAVAPRFAGSGGAVPPVRPWTLPAGAKLRPSRG